MSLGAGETLPKQLLQQTIRHCRKLSVAKKERLELEDLCTALDDRLSDRSITPNQANYDDLSSELVEVEARLAVWSNYNFFMRLIKRGTIKVGIRVFIENLQSIPSGSLAIQSAPEINAPGSGGVEDILPPREVDNASAAATTSRNNHESLPRETTEHESPVNRSAEANQPLPVKLLTEEVTKRGDIPFAEGRYCEVWVGYWSKWGRVKDGGEEIGNEGTNSKKIALKALKTLKPQERAGRAEGTERVKRAERGRKGLENELLRWAELRHANILPLYGGVEIGARLYMVFPWRENGHMLDYVKNNPQSDKNYLFRGSAAGLNYLHLMNFVHGNGGFDMNSTIIQDLTPRAVRCNNVFVTREGEPQICDFGIAKIFHETHENTVSKTMSPATNVRYAAPELIEHNNFSITRHSDTYSFALLILECITEAPPFSNIPRDATVIHARISKKQSPLRPDGKHPIPDDLWELMSRCWLIVPDHRPAMEEVHSFFLTQ